MPGRRASERPSGCRGGQFPRLLSRTTQGAKLSQSAPIPTDDVHVSLVPIRRAGEAKRLARGAGWREGHQDNSIPARQM